MTVIVHGRAKKGSFDLCYQPIYFASSYHTSTGTGTTMHISYNMSIRFS